jgi:hypothetical protein
VTRAEEERHAESGEDGQRLADRDRAVPATV